MRVLKKELWPHKVAVMAPTTVPLKTAGNIHDIEIWLGNNYGAFKERWNVDYQYDRTVYYFRQGQDATMFALRWA